MFQLYIYYTDQTPAILPRVTFDFLYIISWLIRTHTTSAKLYRISRLLQFTKHTVRAQNESQYNNDIHLCFRLAGDACVGTIFSIHLLLNATIA